VTAGVEGVVVVVAADPDAAPPLAVLPALAATDPADEAGAAPAAPGEFADEAAAPPAADPAADGAAAAEGSPRPAAAEFAEEPAADPPADVAGVVAAAGISVASCADAGAMAVIGVRAAEGPVATGVEGVAGAVPIAMLSQ
jgi:hypothetical protein